MSLEKETMSSPASPCSCTSRPSVMRSMYPQLWMAMSAPRERRRRFEIPVLSNLTQGIVEVRDPVRPSRGAPMQIVSTADPKTVVPFSPRLSPERSDQPRESRRDCPQCGAEGTVAFIANKNSEERRYLRRGTASGSAQHVVCLH